MIIQGIAQVLSSLAVVEISPDGYEASVWLATDAADRKSCCKNRILYIISPILAPGWKPGALTPWVLKKNGWLFLVKHKNVPLEFIRTLAGFYPCLICEIYRLRHPLMSPPWHAILQMTPRGSNPQTLSHTNFWNTNDTPGPLDFIHPKWFRKCTGGVGPLENNQLRLLFQGSDPFVYHGRAIAIIYVRYKESHDGNTLLIPNLHGLIRT